MITAYFSCRIFNLCILLEFYCLFCYLLLLMLDSFPRCPINISWLTRFVTCIICIPFHTLLLLWLCKKVLMEPILGLHFRTCFLWHTDTWSRKCHPKAMFLECLDSRSISHDAEVCSSYFPMKDVLAVIWGWSSLMHSIVVNLFLLSFFFFFIIFLFFKVSFLWTSK